MKGTHYKVKAAKARENWNRLKEDISSETDSDVKEKLSLENLEEQLQKDKASLLENGPKSTSKKQKKGTRLTVAHNKLSNAS